MNIKTSKAFLLGLSLLSGLLLSAAWPVHGCFCLIFIAWVPLLLLEDLIYRHASLYSRGAVTLYAFPGFLLWNVLTTWWVFNSTAGGSIAAFTLNALFMALVFNLFHFLRKTVFPQGKGYFSLITVWFAFEYLHMRWELSWSWLNLGNVFAAVPSWVQWYEYTGVFGGALWVLLVNILIYKVIRRYIFKASEAYGLPLRLLQLLLLLIVPWLISQRMFQQMPEKGEAHQVVLVQPNVDPYTEEFTTPLPQLLHNMLSLARRKTSEQTRLVLFPETAVPKTIYEMDFPYTYVFDSLRRFQRRYSSPPAVILGLSTRRLLPPGSPPDPACRRRSDSSCVVSYNTAGFIAADGQADFYHKAKLVPAVERMPYPAIFGFLDQFAIELGGASGSLGTSPRRKVFHAGPVAAAPVICYESIYGEFVTGYVEQGANLICIITNDGWWGDSPGHRQHYAYARLRAIETRRDIARAANTGISGFFNQKGEDFDATAYAVPAVCRRTVHLNNDITFYVRHGDYLGRFSLFISILLSLISITVILRREKK